MQPSCRDGFSSLGMVMNFLGWLRKLDGEEGLNSMYYGALIAQLENGWCASPAL